VIAAERTFDPTIKRGDIQYYDTEKMIDNTDTELVVAELNDVLIGCGYARIENAKHYLQHPRHAYLGFMYVDHAYRGKGVNKLIIEALKAWSLTRNITEMRLEVYYENASAIKAYEKAGFSKHMIEMRMSLKNE
jgi:GNAT superfamily N-acetyltransferase